MPALSIPSVAHYVPAKPTNFDRKTICYRLLVPHYYLVDYADLAIIDLGKATTLEGRHELAVQVREAMSTVGFFYIVNHGLTRAQVSIISG